MNFSQRKSKLPRILGVLATALCAVAEASFARAQPANVLVIEADSSILEAPTPLPLAGRRLRLSPNGTGGYATATREGEPVTPRGQMVRFMSDADRALVRLQEPIELFGEKYRELYVHPHGAVSLAEPIAPFVVAREASPGLLREGLLAGPAVVAPFWNELAVGRAIPGGGVFIEQQDGETSVTWVGIPSVRPADAPNTFRVRFRKDGVIDLDYGAMSAVWGVVGVVPPARVRSGVRDVDFAAEPRVPADHAALAEYRDRPALNEIALARRVYERVSDVFEFMTVLSTVPVDAPHLVYSTTVKNTDRGIALRLFDQSALFGSQRLEHLILLNDIALWAEDPAARPRAGRSVFAESALAVLAHEVGHRWLAHLGTPFCSGDGHWSYFLDSDASLMGGHRLRQNADGSFTSIAALEGFSSLDLYLMGLLPAAEVEPFFSVGEPHDLRDELGVAAPLPPSGSRPRVGVTFAGERHDHTIDTLIRALGPRDPAGRANRSYRMLFVLLVPAGGEATPAELDQVERLRRAFGSYFRRATRGRARMVTRIPPTREPRQRAPEDLPLVAGVPRILEVRSFQREQGRHALEIDFADYHGDVASLEIATDVAFDLPPTQVELDGVTNGARRGTITLTLREVPGDAGALLLTLVDAAGQRSPVFSWPLDG